MTKTTLSVVTMTTILLSSSIFAGISNQNAFGVGTIDFDNFASGTFISTQYETDGAHFSSANYRIQILNDAGETPPGPPSSPNILVSNKGANDGDIIISIVDPVTGNPTDASSIEFYLYSIGNNAVTVEAKNDLGDVLNTEIYQHIDVGGINCDYPTRPDCPGPITNGWGQTDFYSFSGDIRTVTVTSSQEVAGDGYGIDDVLIGFSSVTEVEVDIKPGSDPSSWNCKKIKGGMPIAVFSTPEFDAGTIDLSTLSIGGLDVTEVHNQIHLEDKNDDGLDDAVLHLDSEVVCEATSDNDEFPLKETAFITIAGSTTDDIDFEGLGDIRIVKR